MIRDILFLVCGFVVGFLVRYVSTMKEEKVDTVEKKPEELPEPFVPTEIQENETQYGKSCECRNFEECYNNKCTCSCHSKKELKDEETN